MSVLVDSLAGNSVESIVFRAREHFVPRNKFSVLWVLVLLVLTALTRVVQPLVRAVQELDDSLRQRDEMVASLETRLAAQQIRNETRVDTLMKRLTALEQQIAKP